MHFIRKEHNQRLSFILPHNEDYQSKYRSNMLEPRGVLRMSLHFQVPISLLVR